MLEQYLGADRVSYSAGLSEAEVRTQLRQDELREARDGRNVMHESSAPGFIIAALHIETLQ